MGAGPAGVSGTQRVAQKIRNRRLQGQIQPSGLAMPKAETPYIARARLRVEHGRRVW